MNRRHLLIVALTVAMVVIVGLALVVSPSPAGATQPLAAGPTLRLNLGPADPTLDPARVTDGQSDFVTRQLFLSLVVADEESGAPLPELATSWESSPDATVFTFTLRSGLTWTDGSPLTAHDVRYGILRSLDPATASDLAWVLFPIRNAEEYNAGTLTDPQQVGVTVLGYTHLRFALKESAAHLPSVLTTPVARPVPGWVIAAHPADWTEPEHIVTCGAYRLASWTHGASLTLEKDPGYVDAPNVQIERVAFSMFDEETAWGMYLAGQLDSVLVPQGQWDAARHNQFLSGQLHAASSLGTYYYGFNLSLPPFDHLLVRKAFVAAVDRQGLVDVVASRSDGTTVQGLPAALAFTPPGIWGHVDGAAQGIGIPYDQAQARLWLAAAGYPAGAGLPPITLVYNTHPLHQAVAEYLRQNWAANLGVTVNLSHLDWDAYRAYVCGGTAQLWRASFLMDHYDAQNFLGDAVNRPMWICGRGPYGHWSNAIYESLLGLAARTSDPLTRASLYRQAEEILVETDAIMLPLYYWSRGVAAKPTLTRSYGAGGWGGRIAEWRLMPPAYLPLVRR